MGRQRKKRTPDTLWRLLGYVKPYWLPFAGATACGVVKFTLPVAMAWVVREAVDILTAVTMQKMTAAQAWPQLQHWFIIGLIIALVSPIPVFLRSAVGARAVQQVIRDLRCDLYAHIQKLSHSFFDANRSGSLTSRIIGDVEAIQPFLNQGLIQGWMNVILIIEVLVIFFTQNVYLALLSMLLLPFHIIVQRCVSWKVKENSRAIRDQLAGMAGSTQEKLAASTIVKAFTREEDEVHRFSEDSNALIDMGIRNSRLNGLSQASVTCLNSLAPLLVILVGGYLALFHSETVTLGLLTMFIMMQGQLYGPFERLNELQLTIANAMGATERIFGIFDTEPEIADAPRAIKAPRFQGNIQFDDVYFSYPDASNPILRGLTLTVPAHTTLALVGPSGGGKTTITHLINRFYEWEHGILRIDGRDVRDYTIYSLRHQIGLVPQDPVLFSGTIEENIWYGRPEATLEEVHAAARRAYAADFIDGLEDGYQTLLGERGIKLSGGQKQRIAIARAFLKDPAILILDEATSALDSESERIVQLALEELMQERTTVVIAHRLSTIRTADQIAVIEQGRMVECGRHEELLAHDGLYAALCQQQFGATAQLTEG